MDFPFLVFSCLCGLICWTIWLVFDGLVDLVSQILWFGTLKRGYFCFCVFFFKKTSCIIMCYLGKHSWVLLVRIMAMSRFAVILMMILILLFCCLKLSKSFSDGKCFENDESSSMDVFFCSLLCLSVDFCGWCLKNQWICFSVSFLI